jgi:hypothetical protein
MSHHHPLTRARGVLVLALGLLAACADDPSTPAVPSPQFDASSENGALVEVGSYGHTFGLIIRDAGNQLLLYYRWDDGFCGGPAPTEFVQSTYRDIVQIDERWRTLDKTEELWFYVYPWDGTTTVSCAFLRSTTPLATGRGSRLLHDNDFFPFAPYGPGPGANAYFEAYRGSLTTPAGQAVELLAMIHYTVAADGITLRHWNREIRLSPDPR